VLRDRSSQRQRRPFGSGVLPPPARPDLAAFVGQFFPPQPRDGGRNHCRPKIETGSRRHESLPGTLGVDTLLDLADQQRIWSGLSLAAAR
jgi:hypothetical protein